MSFALLILPFIVIRSFWGFTWNKRNKKIENKKGRSYANDNNISQLNVIYWSPSNEAQPFLNCETCHWLMLSFPAFSFLHYCRSPIKFYPLLSFAHFVIFVLLSFARLAPSVNEKRKNIKTIQANEKKKTQSNAILFTLWNWKSFTDFVICCFCWHIFFFLYCHLSILSFALFVLRFYFRCLDMEVICIFELGKNVLQT